MSDMNKLYILIRNDLHSMNTGKAIAQSSHCVSQFMTKYPKDAKEWCKEADGFGTTVVMEGSQEEIEKFMCGNIRHKGYENGDIIDPTYPFKLQEEIIPFLVEGLNDIQVVDYNTDPYGMVKATRKEYTASWFYFPANCQEIEPELKEKMEECNIKLYR